MQSMVFEVFRDSILHVEEVNNSLNVSDLEAEVINLSSFLYVRTSKYIDFKLDYLDNGMVEGIASYDVSVIQEVIDAAMQLFPKHYTQRHASVASQAVLMNLEVMGINDYSSFLKAYFSSKHKISIASKDENVKTEIFKSPMNSLWNVDGENEVKVTDSFTDREVIFQFNLSTNDFDILINPYNPNVKGKIVRKTTSLVTGISNDKTRKFDFHYEDSVIQEVVMHRLDKGDIVRYHNEVFI